MEELDPTAAAVLATVVSAAAAYAMVSLGVAMGRLHWRRRPTCPSCGLPAASCSCR